MTTVLLGIATAGVVAILVLLVDLLRRDRQSTPAGRLA